MKKTAVPLVIVFAILTFAITKSCVKETRHSKGTCSQLVEKDTRYGDVTDKQTNDDNVITIIGSPLGDIEGDESKGDCVNNSEVLDVAQARVSIDCPEQVLCRIGYVVSYNSKTKNANWVAWHLTKEHTDGPYKRDGIPYMVDEDVNGPRQELEDWLGHDLAIDHGHLCPAGDNKWDKEAMEQTFLLTNMCPQNSELNRGDWEYLERRCRGWARHYGEVYIVAGPIFYSDNYTTIGNKVGVPDAFFKVVLCMNNPKALGFIYPNIGDHHELAYYMKSVDEVEEITGIDFFYTLPDSLESVVEYRADLSKW